MNKSTDLCQSPPVPPKHIGFVSTRFKGLDGVTLETHKWAKIFSEMGHSCFWMAGELNTAPERSYEVPLAHFKHPAIMSLQAKLFGTTKRSRLVTNEIHQIKDHLKDQLYHFIKKFKIELLVAENVLSLPVHVPLGLAVTEVIAETGIPTIAHHHDFAWERERFRITAVDDFLNTAFPPSLPSIEHVVINSLAQKELARRRGLLAHIIPNVLDFENQPNGIDDYNRDFRSEIGLSNEDWLILQPTRVVPRKGIEYSIELVHYLEDPRAKLVLSHPSGDEGDSYLAMLKNKIAETRIDARFIADRIEEKRGINSQGKKIYSLFDLYPHADLVTYPSLYEGFGNAFLEAVYFGKPILVNTYPVYRCDIKPLGFKTIEISQSITRGIAEQVRELLSNQSLRTEWANINYTLALKHFSFAVARQKLCTILSKFFGTAPNHYVPCTPNTPPTTH